MSEPPRREQTAWLPGLLGFYASLGMSSLGGAVAGVGFFVVREGGSLRTVLMWLGCLMMLAGLVGGIRFLSAARRER